MDSTLVQIAKNKDNIRKFNPLNKLKGIVPIKSLEQLANIDKQIEIFKNKNIDVVKGEVLYEYKWVQENTKVYEHYDESIVAVNNDNKQVTLDFITSESRHKLINQDYAFMHIGLIIIGITGLHRHKLGTKVLLSIVDTSFIEPQKAIIGTMEIDMSNNKGLVDFNVNKK